MTPTINISQKNWPATFTVGTSGHQCYGRLERCLSPASRVAGAIFSTWMWRGLLLLINKIQKVEVQTCHDKLYHSWVECKFRIGKWFFTANAWEDKHRVIEEGLQPSATKHVVYAYAAWDEECQTAWRAVKRLLFPSCAMYLNCMCHSQQSRSQQTFVICSL